MTAATIQLAAPGIYPRIDARDYHTDPCIAPSLSASVAAILCGQSPRHAWTAHPRLNPRYEPDTDDKFDLGTVAHALFLEGRPDAMAVIEAHDYRTSLAKLARDKARASGKTPLLAKHAQSVVTMLAALRDQLDAHQDGQFMFKDGDPEQTLVWFDEEFGVWCRSRVDYLRGAAIDDLKTTTNANPDAWTRQLFNLGSDVQAAFYLRGLKAITGIDAAFRFAVVETEPPYALSVIALGPDVLTLAEKKVRYALEMWARCLASNDWPAYPPQTCYAILPPWEESRWLQKEGGL